MDIRTMSILILTENGGVSMTRKILVLIMMGILVFTVVGCGSVKPGKGKEVVFMTDTGDLGDGSFNDLVNEGIIKAEKELGVKGEVLEPTSSDDYVSTLKTGIENNPELVMTLGLLPTEAVNEVAVKNPNQKFVVFDSKSDISNVTNVTFKVNEGSFLVGIIAGLSTESNVIGFIGGIQTPETEKYEFGFRAGVKSVNPQAEVLVNYIGSFSEPELGNDAAIAQNQLGADVIFHAAGGSGLGVIKAAEDEGFWVIGVNKDESDTGSNQVLCSMVKRYDTAAYNVINSIIEGKTLSGSMELGVKEQGIEYADNNGNLSDEIKSKVDSYKEAISKESFEVPNDSETFNAFEGYNIN